MKIFWLDDEIRNLDAFVDRLVELGNEVRTADTISEANRVFKTWKPDVFLIDLNLEGEDSGVEFIRILVRKKVDGVIIALSSYLYRKSYRDALSKINRQVLHLDKIIPVADSAEFENEFYSQIKSFYERKGELETLFLEPDDDPFSVTFFEWRALKVEEKDVLDDIAEEQLSEELKKRFDKGAVWIVYCGSKEQPSFVTDNLADVWSDAEIIQFGRAQGYVPFCFFAPSTVAEVWSANCFLKVNATPLTDTHFTNRIWRKRSRWSFRYRFCSVIF